MTDAKTIFDELVSTRCLRTAADRAIAMKVANLLTFTDSTSSDAKTIGDLLALLPEVERTHLDLSLLTDWEVKALHRIVGKATVAGEVDGADEDKRRVNELRTLRDEVIEARDHQERLRQARSEVTAARLETGRVKEELAVLKAEISRLAGARTTAPAVDPDEILPPRKRLRRAGSSLGELTVVPARELQPHESASCAPLWRDHSYELPGTDYTGNMNELDLTVDASRERKPDRSVATPFDNARVGNTIG